MSSEKKQKKKSEVQCEDETSLDAASASEASPVQEEQDDTACEKCPTFDSKENSQEALEGTEETSLKGKESQKKPKMRQTASYTKKRKSIDVEDEENTEPVLDIAAVNQFLTKESGGTKTEKQLDAEEAFLASLIPVLKSLPENKKMSAKIKIMQVLETLSENQPARLEPPHMPMHATSATNVTQTSDHCHFVLLQPQARVHITPTVQRSESPTDLEQLLRANNLDITDPSVLACLREGKISVVNDHGESLLSFE